jgi:hypothetical protein
VIAGVNTISAPSGIGYVRVAQINLNEGIRLEEVFSGEVETRAFFVQEQILQTSRYANFPERRAFNPCTGQDVKTEGVGFEPTEPFGSPVFKTGAINHSTTPPGGTPGWGSREPPDFPMGSDLR